MISESTFIDRIKKNSQMQLKIKQKVIFLFRLKYERKVTKLYRD